MTFWFTPSSWLSASVMSRTTRKEPSTWTKKTTSATLGSTPIKFAWFSIWMGGKESQPESWKSGPWRNAPNGASLTPSASSQGAIGHTLTKTGPTTCNSTKRPKLRKWGTSSWRSSRSQWSEPLRSWEENGTTAKFLEMDRSSTSASTSLEYLPLNSTSAASWDPSKKKTSSHSDLHRPHCPEKKSLLLLGNLKNRTKFPKLQNRWTSKGREESIPIQLVSEGKQGDNALRSLFIMKIIAHARC